VPVRDDDHRIGSDRPVRDPDVVEVRDGGCDHRQHPSNLLDAQRNLTQLNRAGQRGDDHDLIAIVTHRPQLDDARVTSPGEHRRLPPQRSGLWPSRRPGALRRRHRRHVAAAAAATATAATPVAAAATTTVTSSPAQDDLWNDIS